MPPEDDPANHLAFFVLSPRPSPPGWRWEQEKLSSAVQPLFRLMLDAVTDNAISPMVGPTETSGA